ncbi:MAG: hypothetical protein LAN64_17690 [Acidobacteriia bacterium]|nr:hypothetical protein [Terriglobia bacterium]
MPFPPQTPRAFTTTNVQSLNPNRMGCYGLMKIGEWIYVGKGDIRERLLAHLNGDNLCIVRLGPTHWVDVVTRDYDAEEKRLIRELTPTCNQTAG